MLKNNRQLMYMTHIFIVIDYQFAETFRNQIKWYKCPCGIVIDKATSQAIKIASTTSTSSH